MSRAQIFVSSDTLTRVFSEKLQESHSKIKNLAVHHDEKGATLSGSINKGIPVHFSIQGPVSTDGSTIRLDARSIKADGVPVKDLLKLFGAELDSIFPVQGLKGIEMGDNYLTFSPEAVAHLKGHIAGVSTSREGLTIRYTPSGPSRHNNTLSPGKHAGQAGPSTNY